MAKRRQKQLLRCLNCQLRQFIGSNNMLSRDYSQLDCLQGVSLLMSTHYQLTIFTENLFPNRQYSFRGVPWPDCILLGSSILMPSCYNLLLHRHDLHQKSFCELSVLFREVLWLDCILPGCRTLMPSCITCCYIGMIFTKNLFVNSQCFFVKFFGFIVFSQVVVH